MSFCFYWLSLWLFCSLQQFLFLLLLSVIVASVVAMTEASATTEAAMTDNNNNNRNQSVLARRLSRCDVSSAAQRIVGQNSQNSMLACILQNATGCSKASWYFWHTAFDKQCIRAYSSSGICNSMVVWVSERSDGIFLPFFLNPYLCNLSKGLFCPFIIFIPPPAHA